MDEDERGSCGQAHLVSYAEEAAWEYLDEDRVLDPAELNGFAQRVLAGAGWGPEPGPEFRLDLGDGDAFSGQVVDGVIRLDPRLLHERLVVHELAHWVDPRDAHGPRFCANYLGLLRAAQGDEAARELLAAFVELGVEVDLTWLELALGNP